MKNIMKRLLAIAAISALSLSLLAGCNKKEEPAPQVGLPNPMTEVSAEDMAIPMAPPADAENVKYFTINTDGETLYQMDFTYGGKDYTYRTQMTDELEAYDMSGLYYEKWDSESAEISYCGGIVQTNESAGAVYWIDIVPGINYTLGCSSAVSAEELVTLANEIFAPAQGEVDGDTVSPDLAGEYLDGNENSVILVNNGVDLYDIEIGIFRLSTFDGEGRMADGSIEFTVMDPNGGDLFGTFSPAEDGTYTLTFTESTWRLLESGTVFEGFTLAQ